MIETSPIRIGTRQSALAIVQTQQVIDALGLACDIVTVVSSGDKIIGPLRDHGGKCLFTKELDQALLQGEIDLAVHSMKDVETPLLKGLEIGAVPWREDPRDVLIAKPKLQFGNIEKNIVIGTSSLRRERQLMVNYPNITVVPCRGNIQTRLQKYVDGEFDGIVLAMAGLARMKLLNNGCINGIEACVHVLDADRYVPAAGQGALVVIKRSNDHRFDGALKAINHPDSLHAIQIERAVVDELNLTCHDPVGVHAQIREGKFFVNFMLFSGKACIEQSVQGQLSDRQKLIEKMVRQIQAETDCRFVSGGL